MSMNVTLRLIVFFGYICVMIKSQYYRPITMPFGVLVDEEDTMSERALSYKLASVKEDMEAGQRVVLRPEATKLSVHSDDVMSSVSGFCELIKSGVFAIFGTHTSDTIEPLQASTSALHMPFITPRLAVNASGQELGYTLFMKPYYMNAVLDVFEKFEWKKVVYVYNSDDGLARINQLSEDSAKRPGFLSMQILRTSDITRDREILRSTAQSADVIILDLPSTAIKAFFSTTENHSPMAHFTYFLMDLNIQEVDLDVFYTGGLNIYGFRIFDNSSEEAQSFLGDWVNGERQQFTHEGALAADAIRLMEIASAKLVEDDPNISEDNIRSGRIWPGWRTGDCGTTTNNTAIPWSLGPDMMGILRNITFSGLTGNVMFNSAGLRTSYDLDLLASKKSSSLAKVGHWDDRQGFTEQHSWLPQYKRRDARRVFRVTSILTQPFLERHKDGQQYKYSGYIPDLISDIMDALGEDYELVLVRDGRFGSQDSNGTWDGMIGELIRGEADLAASPLTITHVRERYVDFSKAFMSSGISLMMKRDKMLLSWSTYIFMPFSLEVWLCIVAAFFVASVIFYIINRLSPLGWHVKDTTEGPKAFNYFNIKNSLWYCLGCVMLQGTNVQPKSISGRIFSAALWMFSLCVVLFYLSILIRGQIDQRNITPINSIEDLADQTKIKYGCVQSGSTHAFFRTSTEPLYVRMWSYMSTQMPSVMVRSNEEGVRRVRDGNYAFFIESTSNTYINQRAPCDTKRVGDNLNSVGYGLAFPIGSDIRDQVNMIILQLRESGRLAQLEKKWFYDKGHCGKQTDLPGHHFMPRHMLTMRQFWLLFEILLGCLVLALLVAAGEFLHRGKKEAARTKVPLKSVLKSQASIAMKGCCTKKPDEPSPSIELPEEHRVVEEVFKPEGECQEI